MSNKSAEIKGLINLTETYDIPTGVEIQRNINEGYSFMKLSLALKYESFGKFLSDIRLKEALDEYDYTVSKHNMEVTYKNNNIIISASGSTKSIYIDIYAKTEEKLNFVFKTYMKYYELNVSEIECFFDSYYLRNGQVESNTVVKYFKDFKDLDESYYPYIDLDVMYEQFAVGYENILLCVGDPGLGKSKLASMILKYSFLNPEKLPYDKFADGSDIDNQFINVAYVKSPEILSKDEFWRKLENLTPDFVIIDDLDYMLTKRDAEIQNHEDSIKNNFLNQFLSFTDGVNKNKTKFIITTNQPYDSIDMAILRKGRIFDILELRKLKREEAKNIWLNKELNLDDFNKTFTDEWILSADLGSEIAKRTNEKIRQEVNYLKEAGISKITRNKKKIGI